jgi:glycosyltransferase involved in cell wall biosynthesis
VNADKDLGGGAGPLVSVVLPTYNRAATLPRAISSILHQGYDNLEILVIDDGSTDNTTEAMARITDPRVRYVPLEKNMGASRARNAGLRLARGDYIAFQDSDDEWLAGKLEKQLKAALEKGPGPVSVFHPKIMYGCDERANYGKYRVCCLPAIDTSSPPDFHQLVHQINIISPQTLLISRAALDKVGPFDERLVNNNDWGFAIDIVYNTDVVYLDEPLVMTYLQGDSLSTLKRKGVRCQLLIMRRLRACGDLRATVYGAHLGRIGWGLAKLGNPRLARRMLFKAVRLQPANWKNWARLVVTEFKVLTGQGRKGSAPRRAAGAEHSRAMGRGEASLTNVVQDRVA